MKERPIIFTGEMVRAVLDGRKTQTRQAIKPQPIAIVPEMTPIAWNWNDKIETFKPLFQVYMADICPYGIPGDRLWVRETWGAVSPDEYEKPLRECRIEYRADLSPGSTDYPGQWPAEEARGNDEAPKWRPSIHMPRWASRITLEITGTRAEQLQDISGAESIQEGWPRHLELFPSINTEHKALVWFRDLWDSLNAKRGLDWDVNPWVWVIEFRKLETVNNARICRS